MERDKNKILQFRRISILFCIVLGTILHFTYAWSNENSIVAAFSAVNESVWEHLKLVFFPMLIISIIGFIWIGKNIPNYWCIRLFSIVIAIGFITTFFYTYTGIIGQNFAVLDIGSFVVAIVLAEYYAYYQLIKQTSKTCHSEIAIMLLVILFLAFVCFTYQTPRIAYFMDPITNAYGIHMDEG